MEKLDYGLLLLLLVNIILFGLFVIKHSILGIIMTTIFIIIFGFDLSSVFKNKEVI